jgi:hypothetical protein
MPASSPTYRLTSIWRGVESAGGLCSCVPPCRPTMMRVTRTALSLLCCAAVVGALSVVSPWAVAAQYAIDIDAQPQRPPAGGEQPCVITVRLTDTVGAPVRDGTQVTFVTTLGTIDPQVATTVGGIARADLACATPGRVEVSVLVEGQRNAVVVEFTGSAPQPATATPPAPRAKPAPMIRIEGKYVAYSADYGCITAADQARAQHGALVIEAGNLQYEIARGLVKAQHAVRVRNGAAVLEGERACYHISTCDGVLLRAQEGVERVAFRADALGAAAATPTAAADLAPADTTDTTTWIVARNAIVFPSDRIQFTNATLYVGDKRVFSLPHYVAPLRGQRNLLNQVFSVSSSGGLNLDLPFYYAANVSHVGSLHLRRRSRDGYGYGQVGWSLGVEEQYRFSQRSTGTLAVDGITDSTRSVRMDHQLDLGTNGRVSMGLNYYRYNPSYPGALTGRAFWSKRVNSADLSVIALGSSMAGQATWSLDSSMRWGNRPIGHSGFDYDVMTNLGYGSAQYGYGGGLCLGGGLAVSPPSWEISRSTSASLDLAQQFLWAQIGGQRTTFDARAMVRQGLGVLGALTMSYDYNLSQGGYYSTYGRQQLSLNAYLSRGFRWRASGYASYSLDRDSFFASGNASYSLPIQQSGDGSSPWRLDLRGSVARFGTAQSMSSRIAIGRAVGSYEALLCYSPTASYGYGSYGYGYGGGKTLWLEFAPLGY